MTPKILVHCEFFFCHWELFSVIARFFSVIASEAKQLLRCASWQWQEDYVVKKLTRNNTKPRLTS
jgi:hypothetical protein